MRFNKLRESYIKSPCIDNDISIDLMCLFVKIILKPQFAFKMIGKEKKKYLDKQKFKDGVELIPFLVKNAIKYNLIYFIRLVLDLKLISRDKMITFFPRASTIQMIDFLYESLSITNDELRKILSEDFNPSMKLNIIKYFVSLMESFNLNMEAIFDNQNQYPLLHRAIFSTSFPVVKFLLEKGANPHVTSSSWDNSDALTFALSKRESILSAIKTCDLLNEQLTEIESIIDILKKYMDNTSNNLAIT
jgi:hypothetical protein